MQVKVTLAELEDQTMSYPQLSRRRLLRLSNCYPNRTNAPKGRTARNGKGNNENWQRLQRSSLWSYSRLLMRKVRQQTLGWGLLQSLYLP